MSAIRMEVYGLTGPPCPVIATQPTWPGIGLSNQLCSGVTAYGMQQNANLFFDVDVLALLKTLSIWTSQIIPLPIRTRLALHPLQTF